MQMNNDKYRFSRHRARSQRNRALKPWQSSPDPDEFHRLIYHLILPVLRTIRSLKEFFRVYLIGIATGFTLGVFCGADFESFLAFIIALPFGIAIGFILFSGLWSSRFEE